MEVKVFNRNSLEAKEFWKNKLEYIDDKNHVLGQFKSYTGNLSQESMELIFKICKHSDVLLYSILIMAFNIQDYLITKNRKQAIYIPSKLKDNSSKNLPIVSILDEKKMLKELLVETRTSILEAYKYDEFYQLQYKDGKAKSLVGFEIENMDNLQRDNLDFIIKVSNLEDKLSFICSYKECIYDECTIKNFMACYEKIIYYMLLQNSSSLETLIELIKKADYVEAYIENYNNAATKEAYTATVIKVEDKGRIIEFLIDLWSRSLDRKTINITDNIFDIGGTSILIYKLADEINEGLGTNIKPIDMMMYPNIEKLSDYIVNVKESSNRNINDEEEETSIRERKRRGKRYRGIDKNE